MTERTTLGALGVLVVGLALAALAARPLPTTAADPAPERHEKRAGRGEGHRKVVDVPAPELEALRDGGKLDPNRATAAELELLPGIGPTLAARIVEDRAQRGPFPSIDALGRVSGIGARRLADLRPLVAVASSAPATGSAVEEPDQAGDEREPSGVGIERGR